jgi:hypothetical protein
MKAMNKKYQEKLFQEIEKANVIGNQKICNMSNHLKLKQWREIIEW